jgi:hypothetical protein
MEKSFGLKLSMRSPGLVVPTWSSRYQTNFLLWSVQFDCVAPAAWEVLYHPMSCLFQIMRNGLEEKPEENMFCFLVSLLIYLLLTPVLLFSRQNMPKRMPLGQMQYI